MMIIFPAVLSIILVGSDYWAVNLEENQQYLQMNRIDIIASSCLTLQDTNFCCLLPGR